MMPPARPLRRLAATLTAVTVAAVTLLAQPAPPVLRRIAIFGSSVASGTGDETANEGYAGILRDLLQPRGWEVVNRSRGGDDTAKLLSRFDPGDKPEPGIRYLVPARAGYVVIALSLGNEGIRDVEGAAAKDARVEQYLRGIQALIARSRAAGMIPIVTLCYTRNDFTDVEYGYTRRVNATINQWDVPSVNLLGAVDDGDWQVGARLLVGQPASECSRPHRAGHHVRAVAVRRARARQADSHPRDGYRVRHALSGRGAHLLARYDDASVRASRPGCVSPGTDRR